MLWKGVRLPTGPSFLLENCLRSHGPRSRRVIDTDDEQLVDGLDELLAAVSAAGDSGVVDGNQAFSHLAQTVVDFLGQNARKLLEASLGRELLEDLGRGELALGADSIRSSRHVVIPEEQHGTVFERADGGCMVALHQRQVGVVGLCLVVDAGMDVLLATRRGWQNELLAGCSSRQPTMCTVLELLRSTDFVVVLGAVVGACATTFVAHDDLRK